MTWKSARHLSALLGSVLFLSGLAGSAQPVIDGIPPLIFECESRGCTPMAGQEGRWTLQGRTGRASWRSGASASLDVERFDGSGVVIRRTDLPTSSTRGLTAVYTGKIEGNRIEGTVTWKWPGHWNNHPAEGFWSATIPVAGANPATSQPQVSTVSPAPPISPPTAPTSIVPAAAGGCDPRNSKNIGTAEAMVQARKFDAAQDFGASACWIYIAAMEGDPKAELFL